MRASVRGSEVFTYPDSMSAMRGGVRARKASHWERLAGGPRLEQIICRAWDLRC